jgi:hypothetical protein
MPGVFIRSGRCGADPSPSRSIDTGKFAKHRLESGIGEKMDAALPPSSGGVIAVYDSDGAAAVDGALANAVKKSVAHIDSTKAKDLKAGLAEAQAGMSG